MSQPVIFVGGSKGGVGKSTLSIALIDYLKFKGLETFLIETDTSNPDVYKSYRDLVDSRLINLGYSDGWIDLVNIIEEKKGHTFVINSAARISEEVEKYGRILNDALYNNLRRKFLTLWVINRQRDSLELLKAYMASMPQTELHVIMNLYWGSIEKFTIYESSMAKKKIEEHGGKSLAFPELADRVTDELNVKRYSICKGISEMPLGNRIELERWRSKCAKMFGELAL